MRRPSLSLILLLALLSAGSVLAQDVQYAVGFDSVDGAPVSTADVASGDVVVLRVDFHNGSDTAAQHGAFWVAFPPVDGATLFGNSAGGFSFPDRMLDADGEDVMIEWGADEPFGTLVDEVMVR